MSRDDPYAEVNAGLKAAAADNRTRNARFAAETRALKRVAGKIEAGLAAYARGDAAAAAAAIDGGLDLLAAAIRGQRAWRPIDADLPAIGRFVRALRQASDFNACPRNDAYWGATFALQALQIGAEVYIRDYGDARGRNYNPGMGDAVPKSKAARKGAERTN